MAAPKGYELKQVAILELPYIVNFGSELAVVSMLPTFSETTFDLPRATAGILALAFAFVNFVARSGGDLLSDKLVSWISTMGFLTVGLGIGYRLMNMSKTGAVTGTAGIILALVLSLVCSFFVQAGKGSTFAIVPPAKWRVTGHTVGMVGAYGKVGAVAYLTISSLPPLWISAGAADADPTREMIAASNSALFQVLGIAGLFEGFLYDSVFKEPKGSFAESHEGEAEPATLPVA